MRRRAEPSFAELQFSFPLTHEAVLAMMACFSNEGEGCLLPTPFVIELLTKQEELLRALPNIVEFEVPPGQQICIVGDIHGQYADLMHAFYMHGFPSLEKPYLFNGDFVDRGNQGVEVTLTVFAFQQLYPGAVFLNRGNHEEASCHSVDGFRKECTSKYGLAVYDLYGRLFTRLPLATVLNGAVLVLHGGVDSNFTLEQLRDADRAAYVAIVNSGSAKRKRFARPAEGAKRRTHIERAAQIEAQAKANYPINAALWNDPGSCEGEGFNKWRGTGMVFGRDVCRRWLEDNGLQLIIRSHEEVEHGFEWPFGDGELLVTVFSASNYARSTRNQGAIALLSSRCASSRPDVPDAGWPSAEGLDSIQPSLLCSESDAPTIPADQGCEALASESSATLAGSSPLSQRYSFEFGALSFLQYEAHELSQATSGSASNL
eukprot:jgi/Chrpa1/11496/Chrysochromulina_OHIO_Genome00020651-RA